MIYWQEYNRQSAAPILLVLSYYVNSCLLNVDTSIISKKLSHLHRSQPVLLVDCIQNVFLVLNYLFRNMCRDMQTGMLSKVHLRRTVACLWQVLVQTVWQRQKVGLHLQKGEGRSSSNPTPATGWPESEDNYPQIQPGEGWPGCIQSK